MDSSRLHQAVAIVGMAGRFPGARDVRALWANVRAGAECVTRASEAALLAAGATRAQLSRPDFVPVNASADGLDRFDAELFGISPRDAELMDPQLRVGLETVWEALEDAAIDPARAGGGIGLFMGASLSSYLCRNLLPNRAAIERAGIERALIVNDKDFYPTTISFRLDLRGPSVAVGTACSSSLVAVHLACRSLLAGECRAAIAGASSIHVPFGRGYVYTKEGIYSPDGHCRAFDAAARGTVGGDGAAFVVLKRLEDAQRDGDRIYAVVAGSAVNNDGAAKAGYTAPSVDGQAAVIRAALRAAGVTAGAIGYVEAHGTGTLLGDPVEIAALRDAFGADAGPGTCAIGALKANIGHLDAAAGVAGLIKAACVVRDGVLPPAVNVTEPSPHLRLDGSPFYVNLALRPWSGPAAPRRAGVSAFGVGGTNVHVILEEPPPEPAPADRAAAPWIVPLAAGSAAAFRAAADRLSAALTDDVALADVEITLARGRRAFPLRRAIVASSPAEARARLADATPCACAARPVLVCLAPARERTADGIGRELFAGDRPFREAVDECVEAMADREAAARVRRSFETAPRAGLTDADSLLRAFTTQYAVLAMLRASGVTADRLIGVEVGDLVARQAARELTLVESLAAAAALARGASDATRATRALLVALGLRDLTALLPADAAVAAVCAPEVCVVIGPEDTLGALRPTLARAGVACRWLRHAAWAGAVGDSRLPIRLDERIQRAAEASAIWLELGTGRLLPGLLRRNGVDHACCLPGLAAGHPIAERARVTQWLAAIWERGGEIDWERTCAARGGRIRSLPAYPFQSTRHWIEAPPESAASSALSSAPPSVASSVTSPAATSAAPGAARAEGPDRLAQLSEIEADVLGRSGPVRPMPDALRRALDDLTVDSIAAYLSSGRIGVDADDAWSFDALAARLGVLPKFAPALRYVLDVLRDERLLTDHDDRLRFSPALRDRAPVAETSAGLRARFPEFRGVIDLIEHCARALPESFSTEHGGLRTLYPDGRDTLIRTCLEHTAAYGSLPLCIELLCRWVGERFVPGASRPLRILEVGMGGGILTWNLVPLLKGAPVDVEYVATDITKAMLTAAEQRARREEIAWFSCQPYDVRHPPEPQGLRPGSFDLILALDVLHVVPVVGETLRHLRRLLTPDGVLGIVESTSTDRWPNLVWGSTDGWWAFTDRERTPLMTADRWADALRAAGFDAVTIGPVARDAATDGALLLATGAGVDADAAPAADSSPPSETAPVAPPKRPDLDSWFYAPVWRPWTPPAPPPAASRRRWLLLRHDEPFASAVERRLRAQGDDVITIRQHEVSVRLGPRDYRLRPDRATDYTALVDAVRRDGGIDGIIHAWSLRPDSADPADFLSRLDADQTDGLHSALFLMQALGRSGVRSPLRLVLLTDGTQEVVGGDLRHPQHATLKGAAKVIPQEYPNVRCVHVDVDLRGDLAPSVDGVLAVVAADTHERFVACRGDRGFRLDVEAAAAPDPGARLALRPRGVYLITGGLGGVGLTLAGFLAREAQARLVLVGRTGLPPRAEWPRVAAAGTALGDRVRRVQQLEAAGAEVQVITADLCDPVRLARGLAEAERRFGAIHGVIHTAAVPDVAGVIQRRGRRSTDRAMAAKLRGTLVLDDVLRRHALDFMVLCSALGATVYNLKFGEVGYVAANDFLNAYGHYLRTQRGVPATTISWTDWEEVGMAADALTRLGQARDDATELDHPFWERARTSGSRVRFSAAVYASAQWLFDGHRIGGVATLPGTGAVHAIAEAFCLHAGVPACEIRQLYLLSPVTVVDWERAELAVSIETRGGEARCELALAGQGGPDVVHATCVAAPLDRTPPPTVALAAVRARCTESHRIEPGAHRLGSAAIALDDRWDTVREVWIGDGEGLARLEAGDTVRGELSDFRWHPAVLDSAVAFLNHIVLRDGPATYLPMGYERIRLHAPLEPVLYSHGRWERRADRHGEVLSFDIVITDAHGRALVEIDGLTARHVVEDAARPATRTASDVTYRLAIGRPGSLPTLGFEALAAPPPPRGHVEIDVLAAGMNFKDVMQALGLSGDAPSFGLECVGRIRRVGDGVTDVAPGTMVMAFGMGWTMPFVCVPAAWVTAVPATLTADAAVTLPVAFTIAHYALVKLARLQPGESVLIHSACGGVGLAALQVARRLGATIIATAGTDEKRAHLRALGVTHVSDSRSVRFVADALHATGGRGVDVVLNALAGELLDGGFDALAPRGRFIDLGRRDLAANRGIGLQRLAKGVQFLPVVPDPEDGELASAWREVGECVRDGLFVPLPYRTFDADRVADAFDVMSRGEHIGKLVIRPRGMYPPVPRETRGPAGSARETDAVVRTLVQGMTPSEGIAAFRRALAADRPEVLVSTQDLPAMLAQQEIVSRHGHEAFWSARHPVATPRRTTPDAPPAASAPAAPTTPQDVDEGLRRIWRDLLGVTTIGPDDDFFDLGGDSLIAIRLIAQVRDLFGVEQSLDDVLEAGSFRELAARVRDARARTVSVP